SGLAFTGALTAPAGSSVVTPLTTVMQALIASGATADAATAQTLLTDALGLPAGYPLTAYDPVQGVHDADSGAAAIAAAAGEGQDTVAMLGALLGGAGGQGAIDAVVAALADQIAGTPPGTTIDLSDSSTIASLLAMAADQSGANQDQVNGAAATGAVQ